MTNKNKVNPDLRQGKFGQCIEVVKAAVKCVLWCAVLAAFPWIIEAKIPAHDDCVRTLSIGSSNLDMSYQRPIQNKSAVPTIVN